MKKFKIGIDYLCYLAMIFIPVVSVLLKPEFPFVFGCWVGCGFISLLVIVFTDGYKNLDDDDCVEIAFAVILGYISLLFFIAVHWYEFCGEAPRKRWQN